MRKRIIARSHDHDTVAPTSEPNESVAAAAAVWEGKSIPTMPFDFTNNVATSDATINSATEIYGLGHDENVLIV
jgi:hypothetical protein